MGCMRFLNLLLLLFMLISCAECIVYPSNEGKQTPRMKRRELDQACWLHACATHTLCSVVRGMSKFFSLRSFRLITCDSLVKHTHFRRSHLAGQLICLCLTGVINASVFKRSSNLCQVVSSALFVELGSFCIPCMNFGHLKSNILHMNGKLDRFETRSLYNSLVIYHVFLTMCCLFLLAKTLS